MGKQKLLDRLAEPEALTELELQQLCRVTAGSTIPSGSTFSEAPQVRASVEMIRAIRGFDEASANLVATTNRLTRWILAFTILAVLLAGGSLWLSYLALPK